MLNTNPARIRKTKEYEDKVEVLCLLDRWLPQKPELAPIREQLTRQWAVA